MITNSVPGEQELYGILKGEKVEVEVFSVPHVYSFGTHEAAQRRQVSVPRHKMLHVTLPFRPVAPTLKS